MAEALTLMAGASPGFAAPASGAVSGEATRVLVVEGMHCGACMRKVEQALLGVAGVRAARANLSGRRVSVVTAAGSAAPAIDALTDAVERVGFRAAEMPAGGPATAEAREMRGLLAALGVAGFAAANVMLLSVAVWSGVATDMGPAVETLFHWVSALIALPAVAFAGRPFFRSAVGALAARRLNMDVPISLGVLLATAMSLFQTVRGSDQVYFDAALALLFFLLIGRVLDRSMRARAFGAAANLMGLRAVVASVLSPNGSLRRAPAHALVPGDRILVAAGERIAADGVVRTGVGEVDDALITGETRLRAVAPGATVHAGTVNMGAPIEIEATATDDSTVLAEIGRLMAAAEQGRGRYVRLADRAARLYAPGVHILGASTFIGWMIAGAGWEAALTAAIAVLIITCPCALALAVPAVQVAATSRLIARGIIVKAADGLERMAEIDTVVLDKTGTLTLAEPRVVGLGTDPASNEMLAGAARIAGASRHPYARAIVKCAAERGLAVVPAPGVVETAGAGLSLATEAGEERVGSASWVGAGADADGASLWYARPGLPPVSFRCEAPLRADAAEVVGKLKRANLGIELLSGDRAGAVADAASAVGIARFAAAATPADKIRRLEALKAEGHRVLMIGDGLNDAPALAAAHASLSPATASDIAQTAADAVFQGDALAPVLELLAVARAARRLSKQNFAIALAYNAVFVPLAIAGGVTPLLAAIAMSGSSVAVTANAVRLRTRRL